jgi:single-strand DNA-binding protein
MSDINRVNLTGNLTKDPEVHTTSQGNTITTLRVAVSVRKKQSDGNWGESAGYYDVKVFGQQAQACAEHLQKGRQIAVDGRLDWSEWQDKDGNKRQSVQIIAGDVKFLGSANPHVEEPTAELSGLPF